MAFVGPYYVTGKAFLTKDKTIASLKHADGIDNPGYTVVALKGSTSHGNGKGGSSEGGPPRVFDQPEASVHRPRYWVSVPSQPGAWRIFSRTRLIGSRSGLPSGRAIP